MNPRNIVSIDSTSQKTTNSMIVFCRACKQTQKQYTVEACAKI